MNSPPHFDILIVGAGISGIGAAHHLRTRCPGKRVAILEARAQIGGTWDLFRYPGIRSDSDMFTLGFAFRPWNNPESIADGPSILAYLNETVDELGLRPLIRLKHRVRRAQWSSATARWTVDVVVGDDDETRRFTCGFLFACSGYYRYAAGYTPEFPGVDDFAGEIVHPQLWTDEVDVADKRVVVIGSGATAVTLVPELAREAAHVTMLQRSPTYMFVAPSTDPMQRWLDKLPLSPRRRYQIMRWRNIAKTVAFYQIARRWPEFSKRWLLAQVREELGPDYDLQTHFAPQYAPWDQRICLVPDGDLFEAIRNGSASVVTDHIATFQADGLLLRSGKQLPADLVVTATGLHMELFGGAEIVVDGKPVVPGETMAYRAMMLSDVPNFAFAVGYTNASWTLKVDIVCRYVCRLLQEMDRQGAEICVPELDPNTPVREDFDFTPGYIQRAMDRLPRSGTRAPWRVFDNYVLDRLTLGWSRVDDGVMQLRRRSMAQRADGPATPPSGAWRRRHLHIAGGR